MRNPIKIGDYIKKLRIENKISQKDFACYLNISRSYLCDIEKCRRIPGDNVIKNLCGTLNMHDSYFYYLIGRFPPSLKRTLSIEQYSNLYTMILRSH